MYHSTWNFIGPLSKTSIAMLSCSVNSVEDCFIFCLFIDLIRVMVVMWIWNTRLKPFVLLSLFQFSNGAWTLRAISTTFLVDINQNLSNMQCGTCTLNRINSNQE